MSYTKPLSTLDSIFEDVFEGFTPLFEARQRSKVEPSLQWFEDEGNLYARIDLPGARKEDLHLVFENKVVTLSVSENKSKMRIQMPEKVDLERSEAMLEDGILTLTLPKSPEKKPVTVQIS